MNTEFEILRKVVDSHIQVLLDMIQVFLTTTKYGGKIGADTWGKKNINTICGYVSYSPRNDPEEENIDAMIELILDVGKAKIGADICWADGDIIAEVLEYSIPYQSIDELIVKVDEVCKLASGALAQQLKDLISLNLPPHFRRD